MKTFLTFVFILIIVVGVVPWLHLAIMNGQPLGSIQSAILGWCQLFFFAPIGVILTVAGFQSLVNHQKKASS